MKKWIGLMSMAVVALHVALGEENTKKDTSEELPMLVVKASKVDPVPEDLATTSITLSEEELQRPWTKTPFQALEPIGSIKLNERQNNGIFGAGIDLRGLSSNATSGGNVLLVLDEIPQRRLSFGGPYYGAVPRTAVTEMTLLKGASNYQYGRGALAGTLLMRTDPIEVDKVHFALNSIYESETEFRRYYGKVSGPLTLDIGQGGQFALYGSYDQADGWQENTPSEHGEFYMNVGLQLTARDFIKVVGGIYRGHDNVPSQLFIDNDGDLEPYMDWDTNLAPNDHNYVDLVERRLGFIWLHDFTDEIQLKLVTSYWEGDTDWGVNRPWSPKPANYGVGNSNIPNVRYMTLAWEEKNTYNELSLSIEKDLSEDWRFRVAGGLTYEEYDWDNKSWNYGWVQYDPGTGVVDTSALNFGVAPAHVETDAEFMGAFITGTVSYRERLFFNAGIRWDDYQNDQYDVANDVAFSGEQQFRSPNLGVKWLFLKTEDSSAHVYANWGQNFNPMTRTGVNAGILDADPELSETVEVGLHGDTLNRKIEGDLAVYRVERQDVPQQIGGTYQNSDDWQIDGVEVSVAVRPVYGVRVFSNLTLQDPEIAKSDANPAREGNEIMFVSKSLFKIGADVGQDHGLNGGFQLRYTGDTYADSANTVSVDSYWLTDIFAGYRWEHATLSVYVRNLFDEEYFCGAFDDASGFVFAGTPRTIGVSLGMSF